MTVFDNPSFDDHEGVHVFCDAATGLRAVIAVHSTARGPAGGGTRMWRYETDDDAITDALRLSQGMSFKNAVADLPLGGGKGVIVAPDHVGDRAALFRAYGRCIDGLAGRYVTAEDVGVSPADMLEVARETRFVAGLPDGETASGDPSPVTARGVFRGITICARRALGTDDLTGVRVAVQGVGHVGGPLCDLLHEAGAILTITDVNAANLAAVAARTGAATVDPGDIYAAACDVFAPCALGAVINDETLRVLTAKIVAGAANNQLKTPDYAERLAERGVLYAPDYVINGGGIINVAAEILAVESGAAYDPAWVETKLDRLMATLEDVLDRAASDGVTTLSVADAIARERIAAGAPAKEPEAA